MWRLDARAHSGTHTRINSAKFPRTRLLSAPSFLPYPHSNTDPKTHHISDLVTVSGRYRGERGQRGAGTVAAEMLDIQIPADSCHARFPYIFSHCWIILEICSCVLRWQRIKFKDRRFIHQWNIPAHKFSCWACLSAGPSCGWFAKWDVSSLRFLPWCHLSMISGTNAICFFAFLRMRAKLPQALRLQDPK